MAGSAAVAALVTRLIWLWANRPRPEPPIPGPDARPGDYTIRWAHRDLGGRMVYQGPDLQRARRLFYVAEGIPTGAVVEFYDGPHRRGVRVQ